MKTLSVQQMPDGFEVEVPTFGYWFRAGVGLTLGAFTVSAALGAFGFLLTMAGMKLMLRSMLH